MNLPTNVEYDTDQTSAMTALLKHNKKEGSGQGIIGFLIRKRIVRNEKNARYLLIGFLVVVLILTFYFVHQTLKRSTINSITLEQIRNAQIRKDLAKNAQIKSAQIRNDQIIKKK